MTRGLSSPQVAAATGKHLVVVPLLEMAFTSGTLRLAMSPWNIVVGGNTYLGGGALLSIKSTQESVGSLEGLEVTMTGLDAAISAIAADEPYRGRIVTLSKAYCDPDTNAVIGAPVVKFIGRMRSMTITDQNDTASVTLQAEHYEAELRRPAPIRWNNADQQRFYPGDVGAEHVEALVEAKLVWPAKEALRR